MSIYLVKAGDTLDTVATFANIDPMIISYDNQIPYPFSLAIGQALWLPDRPQTENTMANRKIHVGGYAYPFINRWVLEQTLPYLSELLIFSYGFTTEGHLIPPTLPDDWMIALAKEYGTAPVLTLTPLDENGQFNNYLISQIVRHPEARSTLIDEITTQIQERGFQGVDIDFEYILKEDRDGFTAFVQEVTEAVHTMGYPVSVALAPKTSADQVGLLYEGKDYAALGAIADYVLLMTYEWGYTYGPPMAVAPIPNVRAVVEYAVTEIPPEKIHLGIPNYGYDWPLPFERGVTKAQTLGNIEARQRAIEYGVPIEYDAFAQAPFFHYRVFSGEHEVWFEDVRSMEATFALLLEYGLRGAGYWNIMHLFRANWLLLEETFGSR